MRAGPRIHAARAHALPACVTCCAACVAGMRAHAPAMKAFTVSPRCAARAVRGAYPLLAALALVGNPQMAYVELLAAYAAGAGNAEIVRLAASMPSQLRVRATLSVGGGWSANCERGRHGKRGCGQRWAVLHALRPCSRVACLKSPCTFACRALGPPVVATSGSRTFLRPLPFSSPPFLKTNIHAQCAHTLAHTCMHDLIQTHSLIHIRTQTHTHTLTRTHARSLTQTPSRTGALTDTHAHTHPLAPHAP
jgi:hypothetical protein